jgi:hypothetical protein
MIQSVPFRRIISSPAVSRAFLTIVLERYSRVNPHAREELSVSLRNSAETAVRNVGIHERPGAKNRERSALVNPSWLLYQ